MGTAPVSDSKYLKYLDDAATLDSGSNATAYGISSTTNGISPATHDAAAHDAIAHDAAANGLPVIADAALVWWVSSTATTVRNGPALPSAIAVHSVASWYGRRSSDGLRSALDGLRSALDGYARPRAHDGRYGPSRRCSCDHWQGNGHATRS